MEPPKVQKEFDFHRATKLWMIENVTPQCSCMENGKRYCTCPSRIKLLLRALDGFARDNPECTVTVAWIAKSTGWKERNTNTVIALAIRLGYVERLVDDSVRLGIRKRTGTASTYRICWLKIWNETEESAPRRITAKVQMAPSDSAQTHENVTSCGHTSSASTVDDTRTNCGQNTDDGTTDGGTTDDDSLICSEEYSNSDDVPEMSRNFGDSCHAPSVTKAGQREVRTLSARSAHPPPHRLIRQLTT